MPIISRWKQGLILRIADLTAVFLKEMGLGALGMAPRNGGRWRIVTAHRAERLRSGPRWFCGNAERATMMADALRPQLHKISAPASVDDVSKLVSATAKTLGVLLVSEDRIREQAETVVRNVEEQFASLAARGELKSVNRSYREYRIAETAAGNKPIGYPTFVSNYKLEMVRTVAQHSRINVIENGGDIEK